MSIPVPLDEQRFNAGGPDPLLPYDECFACFAEQGGLLFRLVTYRAEKDTADDAAADEGHVPNVSRRLTPVWAFYNDTTETIMKVRCTFKSGSDVQALGRTVFAPCTPEELATGNGDIQPMAATLDVYPGATELYVAGSKITGFHLSYVTEAAPAMSVEFLNGTPTVRYDKVYKCFKDNGNGLLFRLVDEERHMWAFYNDTTGYVMRVDLVLEEASRSDVRPLGHTIVTMCAEAGDDGALLTVFVEPGATQLLLQGTPSIYRLSFTAEPVPKHFSRAPNSNDGGGDVHSDDSVLLPGSRASAPASLPLRPSGHALTVRKQQEQRVRPEVRVPTGAAESPDAAGASPLSPNHRHDVSRAVGESAIFDQSSYQAGSQSSLDGVSMDVARELLTPLSSRQPHESASEVVNPDVVLPSAAVARIFTDPNQNLMSGNDLTSGRQGTDGEERTAAAPPPPLADTAASPAPPSTFINGRPDPEIIPTYHRVFSCFEGHGNGLLFRLVDDVNHIWAFYNDTRQYTMEVHVRLPASDDLLMAPGVQTMPDITSTDGSGVIASVFVPPLVTAPFLVGEPHDFELAASALPYEPADGASHAHRSDAHMDEGHHYDQSSHQRVQAKRGDDEQYARRAGDVLPPHEPSAKAPATSYASWPRSHIQPQEDKRDNTPHSPNSVQTPVTMRGGRVDGGGGGGSSTLTGDDDCGSWRHTEDAPHGTAAHSNVYALVQRQYDEQDTQADVDAASPYGASQCAAEASGTLPHALSPSQSSPPHHAHACPRGESLTSLNGADDHVHDHREGAIDEETTSVMRTPMVSISYDNTSAPFAVGMSSAEPEYLFESTPPSHNDPMRPCTSRAGDDDANRVPIEVRSTEQDDAEEMPFEHGRPDAAVMPAWNIYYKCFKEHGNGLLFRLVDTHTNTWAFYNDTADHWMEVHVVFEPDTTEPAVEPLGSTHKFTDADLGVVYALEVPPLQTALFCRAPSKTFTTKFMAMPVKPRTENGSAIRPAPPPPPQSALDADLVATRTAATTAAPSISPLSPPVELDAHADLSTAGPEVSEGETINLDAPSITPRSEEARGECFSDGDGDGGISS